MSIHIVVSTDTAQTIDATAERSLMANIETSGGTRMISILVREDDHTEVRVLGRDREGDWVPVSVTTVAPVSA